MSKLKRAIRNPSSAAAAALALAKGWFYKTWYPLRGVRFSAGSNFRVFGKLTVRGPGTVTFGRDVVIGMHVTPFTHSTDSIIVVGDHCFLNGARFGCRERIEVGPDCIIAEARIMDTNFHSTRADRWSADAPVTTRPVRLARNVWIAAQVGLLPGTEIGENSVVGFGAVCSGAFPADVLIAGNPALVVRSLSGSQSATQA